MENWIEVVLSVLSGLIVIIPVLAKLVNVVKTSVQEKNWSTVMTLVIQFMQEAEETYENGDDKKQYVLDALNACEAALNYDIEEEKISSMIDSICTAAKTINVTKE